MSKKYDLPLIRLKRTAQHYPNIRIPNMKVTFPWQVTKQPSDYKFVEKAYLSVLGRWPDFLGMESYLDQLSKKRLDRVDVLRQLRSSEEGRKVRAPVYGVLAYWYLAKIKKRVWRKLFS